MITLLSSPKPFVGIAQSNQVNALRSWLALDEGVEVILYGKSDGTGPVVRELGISWVPDVETSEFGTPLFNAIVEHATRYAKWDVQVYLNCDILLPPEFLDAVAQIPFEQFLMIGQRIDLSEGSHLDVTRSEWPQEVLHLVERGLLALGSPQAVDYFVFRRNLWQGLSPVTIGRGGYDQTLVEYALRKDVPLVDATLLAPVFHQYHDYSHIQGGKQELYGGIEARRNIALQQNRFCISVEDATWRLSEQGLRRAWARGDHLRATEVRLRLVHRRKWLANAVCLVRAVLRRLGITGYRPVSLQDLLQQRKLNT